MGISNKKSHSFSVQSVNINRVYDPYFLVISYVVKV